MKHKIKKTIVDKVRKQAIETGDRIYVWDTDLTGFGVMATPKGSVSYFVEFRLKGRKRRKTIGKHGPFTPEQARNEAKVMLGEVARDIDITAKIPKSISLKFLLEEYLKNNAQPTRYWHEMEKAVLRDAAIFLDREVKVITRSELALCFDKLSMRSKSSGRHLFAALRPMFRWAVERDYIDSNPFTDLKPPSPSQKRERILSYDELKAVWLAAEETWFPFGPLVRLLILTGQRRDEVAKMQREEIQGSIWKVPGGLRTKNRKSHEVDLHKLAIEIIEKLPIVHGLVFSTTGNTAPSGFSRAKRRLDQKSGVTDWKLHDLRRTCASGMAEAGVLPNVIERVLNHRSGVNSGLVDVYQRYEYREERRQALMVWGDKVQALLRE